MPVKQIKFYFIQGPHRGKHVFKWLSPGNSGRWGNIISVDDIKDAKYAVVIQSTDLDLSNFPPERILYIEHEPDEFFFAQHDWDNISPLSHRYYMADGYVLHEWNAMRKSYDELKTMDFPKKTRDLSMITSNLGDGSESPGVQALTGHRLRMHFLLSFLQKFPSRMDLYGRRLLDPRYNYPCNKGQLFDKWDGLANYRYVFAFENSWRKGYFTETISDPILAGCMPIYWGCPNLEDFLPKRSFIRLDITKEDAPERAIEIVNSDFRERHLDALREARELILDKYNIWPMLYRMLNKLERKYAST